MRALAIAAALSLAPLASVARAQPAADVKPDATAEATTGATLYSAGQYHEAYEHFVRAFELDPQPAFLFDAAQAARFAKDCAGAVKAYRQFLDVVKQAQNLEVVRKDLDEMEQCVRGRGLAEPAKPSEHVVAPAAPVASPPPVAPPHVGASRDDGAGKRKLAIALGAVGIAGIATGVGFGLAAEYWSKSCSPKQTCEDAYVMKSMDRGPRDNAIAITGYAVGGAALVGGIALYVLARPSASERVTIVPTPNGATVAVRF